MMKSMNNEMAIVKIAIAVIQTIVEFVLIVVKNVAAANPNIAPTINKIVFSIVFFAFFIFKN